MSEQDTTEHVRVALRSRYCWPKYVLIEEAADGTGTHRGRMADGLALAVWPSSGMWLYGFEIKTSRADLLRELRQPKKWRAVGRYCDYWWLVVTENVWKKNDDLPACWGVLLFVPKGANEWAKHDELRPVRRPRRQETEPMDRPFIASLLRDGIRTDRMKFESRPTPPKGE